MKTLITLFLCACTIKCYKSQTIDGLGTVYIHPTAEIKKLETQESDLKMSGDLDALAINRLAQIAAWQKINPEKAAEFKPNNSDQSGNRSITGSSRSIEDTQNNPVGKNSTDVQVNDFFSNDGVDLDTALNGDIYVCSFIKMIGSGQSFDEIYIYKSINNGASFSLWGTANVPDKLLKMKLSLMDSGSTKYLFTTYSSEGGSLKTLRFNLAGGPLNAETITTGVTDFDIDVDYGFAASAQLYAVYIKSDNALYSARSVANSTGFGWGDEHSFGVAAEECAFTYGKGSTFVSYVGFFTGNHYFAPNSGYNNPAGWQPFQTLQVGSVNESHYITLRAERKPYSSYRVVSIASRRAPVTNGQLIGRADIISYNGSSNIAVATAPNSNSVLSWDSWAPKVDGSTTIKTSFVIQNARVLYTIDYNNGNWVYSDVISDQSALSFPNGSAVAGDGNNNTIAIYCSGEFPTGVFFDTSRSALGVSDNVKSRLSFYPNPVESTLTLNAKSKITNIIIYNRAGQKIRTFQPDLKSSVLNLSDLIRGTYIIQVNIDGVVENHKFIKK